MTKPTKIAIVGMGAVGTTAVIQLVRRFGRGVVIRGFEKSGTIGAGLAYSTEQDCHLLNIPSNSMSVFAERPNDFSDWLHARGEAQGYVPRHRFATYLHERFAETTAGADVQVIAVEVHDCEELGNSVRLSFAEGEELFDYVILCPGHLPRRHQKYNLSTSERFLESPWDFARLARIPSEASVGILGTSLTAVDTLLSLERAGFRGRVTCFSRRRSLPSIQSKAAPVQLKHLTPSNLTSKLSLVEVLELVRREFRELEGGEALWQSLFLRRDGDLATSLSQTLESVERGAHTTHSVLDATKGVIGELWSRLDERGKKIFLERHESLWAMFRHSMPPENARKILALASTGRLRGVTKLTDVTAEDAGFRLTAGNESFHVDYLIDATGSELEPTNLVAPLVDNMLGRGQLLAHVDGGISVERASSRLRFTDGQVSQRICLVGNLTKGVHFYTNSFEMNRDRVVEAVDRIARDERVVYRTRTPDGKWLEIRTVDPERDVDVIWKWWNAPHVKGRWSVDFRLGPGPHTKEMLRQYLQTVDHVTPFIGRIDGVDVGYLETYRVGESPLASHHELTADDCGFHVLIGEFEYLRMGLGNYVGPLLVAWLLHSNPSSNRVVVEPNVKNTLAINTAIKALRGRRAADVQLPHKVAALIIVERSAWAH